MHATHGYGRVFAVCVGVDEMDPMSTAQLVYSVQEREHVEVHDSTDVSLSSSSLKSLQLGLSGSYASVS
jgi:hypothetical protein